MTLYFENSDGIESVIAHPETIEEAYKEMERFMDDHNFTSYYTRVWQENGRLKFDVGSHTEFFCLEGISFEEYISRSNKDRNNE